MRGTLDRLDGEPRFAELRRAAHIDETRKGRALINIVRTGGTAQVLVFTRYRATARWLGELLVRERTSHGAVHGELTAADKQAALAAFRAGTYRSSCPRTSAARATTCSTAIGS